MRRGQSTIEFLVLLGVAIGLTLLVAIAARADGGSVRRQLIESIPGHRAAIRTAR
jgi:molybdopterin biosynthesis enzyme MoaB